MSALNPSGRAAITLLVLGDAGVGKTSLICSLVSESWSERVPPVQQPVHVPPKLMPEDVQLTIVDTSSEPQHVAEWMVTLRPPSSAAAASSKALPPADAILLVVAADVPDSFARVESYWLPLLEEHAARMHLPRWPVILALNKAAAQEGGTGELLSSNGDLSSSLDASFAAVRSPTPSFSHLVHSHRVAAVIPCSAKYLLNLGRLFHACNTVVLAPVKPLFDLHALNGSAAPGCMRFKVLTQRALLRIFRLFDADGDGVLSYPELDRMHQVNFRGKKLALQAFEALMRKLEATDRDFVRTIHPVAATAAGGASTAAAASPSGWGLSFSGLLHFHALFLEKNRHLWHTWSLVQQFGYELAPNGVQAGQVQQLTPGHGHGHGSGSVGSIGALPMQRGSSMGANGVPAASNNAGSASSATSAAAAAAALPSLGSLVLKESYCRFSAEPFSAALSYELSPIAVEFLTSLFHRYDSDRDGLLCVKSASASTATVDAATSDAAPSSTCSLSASSDLERMFLACPDVPFAVPGFTQFVTAIPADKGILAGAGNFLSLDGWLASWALLLHSYASVALPGLQVPMPSAAAASPSSSTHHLAAFAPNPDIVLRYLLYLCFPVEPAVPSSTRDARGQPIPPLPRIQQCIHVTPRQPAEREVIEQVQAINERNLPAAARGQSNNEGAFMRPRSIVCVVVGSAGCGKTALADCMIGKAPTPATPIAQHVSSSTVAGLAGVLPKSPTVVESNGAAAANSTPQARTYATRMPLSHLPVQHPPASASASDPAAGGVIDTSLRNDPNRFLLLKEIPSALAAPMLASASFTPLSCDLVLLLYDGSSPSSLEFARARLLQCAEKQIPVMVVQTKADYANCSLAANDFAGLDYEVPVESFSARLFWSAVQARPVVHPLPAACTLFERIWHAGRHPHAHVLTSLSAARRAHARTRWILGGLLLVAGGAAAWALAQYVDKWPRPPSWGAGTGSAAAGDATAASSATSAAGQRSERAQVAQTDAV